MAAKNYEVTDYQSGSELENGLAVTHEQVSDVYMEGTVDATIENYQGTGEDVKIPEEGFEQG
nr:YozQ family protein [Ammoniphilus resinae]